TGVQTCALPIYVIHSFRYGSKDGIATVKVWSRRMGNEPLRAFGILAGGGKPHRAGDIAQPGKFRPYGVDGAAPAIATVTSALDYKVRHDPVESLAFVIPVANQADKIG